MFGLPCHVLKDFALFFTHLTSITVSPSSVLYFIWMSPLDDESESASVRFPHESTYDESFKFLPFMHI